MKREVVEERRERDCLRVSLSVQDLLRVGGASGREGLARTTPRWEKFERPRRALGPMSSSVSPVVCPGGLSDCGDDATVASWRVGGGLVHGVASACAAIVSSMLASPQGASEQYMWIDTSSGIVNSCGIWSREHRDWMKSDVGYGGDEMRTHSSRR